MLLKDSISRRDAFRIGGAHTLGWTMAQAWLKSPLLADNPGNPQPLQRFPQMLQRYFMQQVRELDAARTKRFEKIHTKAEAEDYIDSVQGKIRESFGPFPEKTPLKARVTGGVKRDTYRIENILFESRPGFLVSANLYIPKGRPFPLPGVVGTCGHSSNGKAFKDYQAFAQGLARQGYVVLIYDPIGQGERLQYPDQDLKSKIGTGVREHLQAGNQQFLVGEFLGAWRTWDGIRALDYLLSREEVDPNCIGVTGNSGGGLMTTWLCGVESRWTMAAPSCFVTTFRRNLENELPSDTEQCPPKALALGLEQEDFLAALAPKPIIILAKEKDFCDVRGSEQAFRRLKKLYRLLGKEENIAMFTGPTYHGYTQENREAMYGFFNEITNVSNGKSEPEIHIEKDETLRCSPNGQVSELGSKSLPSFTRKASKRLTHLRSALPRGEKPFEKLADTLQEYLRLSLRTSPMDYRILRPLSDSQRDGYPEAKPHVSVYAVRTEPGIETILYRLYKEVHYSRPPADSERAILYVSHQSSDLELRTEPLIGELLATEPDSAFYTIDVRGIGESQPNTCGQDSFLSASRSDYFYSIFSLMLDRPYPAQRTHDILCVLDLLSQIGHREIHLVAKGWGTIPATLASVLHDQVKQVTLKNNLSSYSDLAESEEYDWPLSAMLPDVLRHFDLPDCYAALKAKQICQIEPWGARCTHTSHV